MRCKLAVNDPNTEKLQEDRGTVFGVGISRRYRDADVNTEPVGILILVPTYFHAYLHV